MRIHGLPAQCVRARAAVATCPTPELWCHVPRVPNPLQRDGLEDPYAQKPMGDFGELCAQECDPRPLPLPCTHTARLRKPLSIGRGRPGGAGRSDPAQPP